LRAWLLVAVAIACASGPKPAIAPAEDARCMALSDSLSKYISADALPAAHIVGTPRTLPTPANMRPGDSVAVDFVVRPDGVADTSSVQITGAGDPQFVRSALLFATQSRFIPARVSGCNVLSRYNLVVRSRKPGTP
jgi:hypothetical protein